MISMRILSWSEKEKRRKMRYEGSKQGQDKTKVKRKESGYRIEGKVFCQYRMKFDVDINADGEKYDNSQWKNAIRISKTHFERYAPKNDI